MHCIHNTHNVIKRFCNSKELAELTMVIISVLVNRLIIRTPCEQYFSCIHDENDANTRRLKGGTGLIM